MAFLALHITLMAGIAAEVQAAASEIRHDTETPGTSTRITKRDLPHYLDDEPRSFLPPPWDPPALCNDSNESLTMSELEEFEQDQLARQEWDEGIRQLQMAFQLVIIPFLGKWVGRRWSYWSMSCTVRDTPTDTVFSRWFQ